MVIDTLNLKLRQIVRFSSNMILDEMSSVKCCLLLDFFWIAQHEERPLYHIHKVTSRYYYPLPLHYQIRPWTGMPSGAPNQEIQILTPSVPGTTTKHHASVKSRKYYTSLHPRSVLPSPSLPWMSSVVQWLARSAATQATRDQFPVG